MTILYFYQYFTTPNGSYGTRVYEFTKNWVEKGHKVIVVSSVYSKSDIKAKKFLETQIIDGITLKIINIKIDNKQSTPKRIITFILYSIVSIYYALSIKCDIVISSSGPITVGLPGIFAKIIRNKKFVFEVRDLWPEGPIELGIIKNKLIQRISFAFEKLCYNKSDLIVALSPGIKNNIIERFNHKNVISVTNSANLNLFSAPKKPILNSLLSNIKFAIYTGNIGKVNNSDLLVRAALELNNQGRKDISIILIGDGQQKRRILEVSKNISNLYVLDLMPKTELVNYLKNSFASIIPLNDTPMLSTSSPNKLFESMAAGIPVIQTTNGWIKTMLKKTGAGYTVSPINEKELVEKLIYLADNKIENSKIGNNGLNYAINNFDKNSLSTKMINSIENLKK